AILLRVRCGDCWDGAIVVHPSARVKAWACGAGGGRCSGSVSPGPLPGRGLDSRCASERAPTRKEYAMMSSPSCTLWTTGLLGLLLVLTGCTATYDTAVRQLSPAEQTEFAIYQHIMTGTQTRTYLAKTTAAERTAYLSAIGVAQRWQRLDPLD